jgi:hypothetical protein
MTKTTRNYYVGHSYMGTNFTYDSGCWKVLQFGSKKERDEWMDKNEYRDGNRKAEEISYQKACLILGCKPSDRRVRKYDEILEKGW